MKRKLTLSLAILFAVFLSQAQTTVIIKPTPVTSQAAYVYTFELNHGYSQGQHFDAGYNTIGGVPIQSRYYIRFDLSHIPSNAIITAARLNLYNDAAIAQHQGMGNNSTKLSVVNQSWNQNAITWNAQPTVSTVNEVLVGPTTGANSDKTNINVSGPVQYWVSNPTQNYGWRFWQVAEGSYLHSVEDFATSYDTTNPGKMPSLTVSYTVPCIDSIILQEDTNTISNVYVYDFTPTANFPYTTHFDAGYNSINGVPVQSRTYAKYDLSAIPVGATVTDARLSFYNDANIATHQAPGSNSTKLSVVTQSWNNTTLSWNTQPAVSSTNEVIVGATPTTTSDITNINVTAPLQYWVSHPSQNYGWRFWQVSEGSVLHSVEDFATVRDPNPSKRPRLVVRYTYNCSCSPSVSVTASSTSPCSAITFTAAAGNVGSTVASYQWFVNNAPVGTNSAIYTAASLNNNDSVWVRVSGAPCGSVSSSLSNKIKMTGRVPAPSLSIVVNNTALGTGQNPVFTATAVNAGANLVYAWFKNGVRVWGAPFSVLSYGGALGAGDQFYCTITTATCGSPQTVTSNVITMSRAGSGAKDIVAFTMPNQIGSSVINAAAATVSTTVSTPPAGRVSIHPIHISPSAGATYGPSYYINRDFSHPVTYTVTAQNGTTKVWTITVLDPSGHKTETPADMIPVMALKEMSLYPVPAYSYVMISANGGADVPVITILDIEGRVMYNQALPVTDMVNHQIDLSGFSAGTYLVHLQIGSRVETRSLIVGQE